MLRDAPCEELVAVLSCLRRQISSSIAREEQQQQEKKGRLGGRCNARWAFRTCSGPCYCPHQPLVILKSHRNSSPENLDNCRLVLANFIHNWTGTREPLLFSQGKLFASVHSAIDKERNMRCLWGITHSIQGTSWKLRRETSISIRYRGMTHPGSVVVLLSLWGLPGVCGIEDD